MMNKYFMAMALLSLVAFGHGALQADDVQMTTTAVTPDTTTVIITPVPEAKEQVVEPAGYISCETKPAGWYNNQWNAEYRLCRYNAGSPAVQGAGWVSGHWVCTQYTITEGKGQCTNWDWKSGYWVKTIE